MAKKHPKPGASTRVGKRPASPELATIGKQAIVWRFAMMEMDDGPWSWHAITKVQLVEAREKLSSFEESTWADLSIGRTPRLTRIPRQNLDPQAQKRLTALRMDDFNDVYEMRLTGKCRIWGVREEPVFLLLWWDPDHTVCPSHLRHT